LVGIAAMDVIRKRRSVDGGSDGFCLKERLGWYCSDGCDSKAAIHLSLKDVMGGLSPLKS